MIISVARILKRVRSSKIQDNIASGNKVYFESFSREMAFKYIPGQFNEFGKYYAKFDAQDEFEIDPDSPVVLIAAINGRQISKEEYDTIHLIKGGVGGENKFV